MTCNHGLDRDIIDCLQCEDEERARHQITPVPSAELERLLGENAMLRGAIQKMAQCNLHSGDFAHCTCSQREREEIARVALADLPASLKKQAA